MSLADEVKELTGGRPVSAFDRVAVETVAALSYRLKEARLVLEEEGCVVDGRPHPATEVEARCSAELRGWVRSRPDLFGEQKNKGPSGLRKFEPKIV